MQLSIEEYAKQFKMSKEMVLSKIKDSSLKSKIENNTLYIVVPEQQKDTKQTLSLVTTSQSLKQQDNSNKKKKTTVSTIISLYQKENKQLKAKIAQLEEKIDTLIADKEQMLRHERDTIEQLYLKKDEQLKNIIDMMNNKFQVELMQQHQINELHSLEPINVIEETQPQADEDKIVELREYLKSLDLKTHQRKTIKKRFLEVYDNDIRILQQNGKLYLDLKKYDYSDLLKI